MAELKIYLNPNEDEAARIRKRIEENDGYCPCRLLRTPDNRCMCKHFRERNEEGFCLCGLFYKQYEPEEEIEEAENVEIEPNAAGETEGVGSAEKTETESTATEEEEKADSTGEPTE